MKKTDLIHLHKILSEIKNGLEKSGVADNGSFKKYNNLDISPYQISRPKEEHKEAVKILSEDLAHCIK